jgi:hypothetical protein
LIDESGAVPLKRIKRIKPFADTIGSLQEPVSGVGGKSCLTSESKFEIVNTPESSPVFK